MSDVGPSDDSPAARLAAISKDAALYFLAVGEQWSVTVTGGLLIAAVTLWGWVSSDPPSPSVNWMLVAATFVLASFFAWRKEMQTKRTAVADAAASKELVADKLTRTEATAVIAQTIQDLAAHRAIHPDDFTRWHNEYGDIKRQCRERIGNAFGTDMATMIFDAGHPPSHGAGIQHQKYMGEIEGIMRDLRAMENKVGLGTA